MAEAELERDAVDSFGEKHEKVGARSLSFFQGESHNLTEWKSLFKHPPSNIRFRRNSASTREPKRAVTIPCKTVEQPEKPKQPAIPPPKRKNSKSSISNDTRRKEGGPPVQVLKLHDPCGSAGSSSGSCSMSSSPTSQTSTLGEEEEDEIKEVEGDEYFGQCSLCGLPIYGEESGCVALDSIFHNKCFRCQECYQNLAGESFFMVKDRVLCKRDYLDTLDSCHHCKELVTDKVIWVANHPFHPLCFQCTVCGMCLDGVPFATDCSDKFYCVQDYHRTFAPRCQACEEPILPHSGDPNSRRLIAMNLNFHVGCYCCVECGVSLVSSGDEEPQCFPIDQRPLCLECNRVWTMQRLSPSPELDTPSSSAT